MKKIATYIPNHALATLLLVLFVQTAVQCQQTSFNANPPWPSTQASRGGFSFRTPISPIRYDTLGLLSYFSAADSTLAFQVNFMDTVSVRGNQELFTYLQQANVSPGTDTVAAVLEAYVHLIVDVTGAELTNLATINYNSSIRGREVRIRLSNGDGSYQYIISRVYYWQRRFLGLTVSCTENRLTDALGQSNTFFNSVVISP